jgi:hypothetical protein
VSKKQQERKKKKREEIAKKRVLARRNKLRQQSSQNKQAGRLDRKFRTRSEPVIKDAEKKRILEEKRNEQILSKLEKNAEILRALEDEYLVEINQKKAINEKLEAEGHLTLKDKLSALDKQVQDSMTEEEKETGRIDFTKKDEIGEKI